MVMGVNYKSNKMDDCIYLTNRYGNEHEEISNWDIENLSFTKLLERVIASQREMSYSAGWNDAMDSQIGKISN